jgi:hypothetical protein
MPLDNFSLAPLPGPSIDPIQIDYGSLYGGSHIQQADFIFGGSDVSGLFGSSFQPQLTFGDYSSAFSTYDYAGLLAGSYGITSGYTPSTLVAANRLGNQAAAINRTAEISEAIGVGAVRSCIVCHNPVIMNGGSLRDLPAGFQLGAMMFLQANNLAEAEQRLGVMRSAGATGRGLAVAGGSIVATPLGLPAVAFVGFGGAGMEYVASGDAETAMDMVPLVALRHSPERLRTVFDSNAVASERFFAGINLVASAGEAYGGGRAVATTLRSTDAVATLGRTWDNLTRYVQRDATTLSMSGLGGVGSRRVTNAATVLTDPAWQQSAPNSQVLARNLGIGPGSGLDAHHIVPGTHRRGASARAILDRYQIDINAAENGLPVVGGRGAAQDVLPRRHRGSRLHSHEGIDAVTQRLQSAVEDVSDWATGRQNVVNELRNIQNEILNGAFP